MTGLKPLLFSRLAGSGAVLPISIILVWEALVRSGVLDQRFWASPESVLTAGWQRIEDGSLFTDLGTSLVRDFAGFVIGAVFGITVGFVAGRSRLVDQLVSPSLNAVKQIAIFAWIPLISLWVGSGEEAKIVFVALAAFFPVMLNTYEGVRSVDSRYLEAADVFCLSPWKRARRVILPAAAPSIASGIRLGLIYAWLATVGAEFFFESGSGIGSSMIDGRDQFRMDLVILGIMIIGIVGFFFTAFAERIELYTLRWRDS